MFLCRGILCFCTALLVNTATAQFYSANNASLSSGSPSLVASYPPGAPTPAFSDMTSGTTYTNPILNSTGADPWMFRDGDWYYLTYTTNDNITLLRSKSLTDWNHAESKLLFQPPPNQNYSTDLWAPEIHQFNSTWYVIFTADPSSDTPTPQIDAFCTFNCPAVHHRMYVLESSSASLWNSTFSLKSQLNTFDQFAIDGTYFTHASGLYHVYSCWYDAYTSWPANLCITKMTDPWTVASNLTDRTIISVPTNPWEKTPYGRTSNERLSSNEGPQQLTNPHTGQQFIIYSAARSDNPNYCLGQLELKPDGDPMNAADWVKENSGCVFYGDKRAGATGVGHASFVESPDGSESWVVYHGMRDPWDGWAARTIRAQRFGWSERDGTPRFPRPGYGPYEVPSGQVA